MRQAVIFDLDGTLCDTLEDLNHAANWACKRHGWPEYDPMTFQTMVGHGIRDLVRQITPESCQSPLLIAAIYEEFLRYYGEHFLDCTHPYPGIPSLVNELKERGVQLAVLSNKADHLTREIVRRFFGDAFSVILGKRPNMPLKPDPAGALAILRELQVSPEETLFVGDSSVDIETAHAAGLAACGVTWGFRPRESLTEAEYLADDPAGLSRVIRGV